MQQRFAEARRASAIRAVARANGKKKNGKILGISSDPRVVAITRYERSIPQYNLGHFARVQRV